MSKGLLRNYIFPTATLSGSIIGVGFFSLPFIAVKTGILATLMLLVILTAVIVLINLIVGEIALKTPDFKRIPGFLGYHLGKWAKVVSLSTAIFGGFGVLLAYLVVGGDFLTNLLSPLLGGSYILYVFIYFVAAIVFIYFDIKAISKVELGAVAFLLLTLIIIFIKGLPEINLGNLFISNATLRGVSSKFQISNLLLAYGAIIFSLWGVGLIPEAEEMLRGKKKFFKQAIVISVLIPAVIYFLFVVLTVAITGAQTTESALMGLKNVLGGWVSYLGLFMGSLIIFNAMISLGLILKKVLMYDLGVKKRHAVVFTLFPPMILFLLGLRSFIPIVSFIGGVFIGIDGILILLTYKKIGGKKIIIFPLAIVFALGVVYEIVLFLKF